MQKRRAMFITFLVLTMIWFVFMTYLSHQDGLHTRETSLKLAERLEFWNNDIEELNHNLRRGAHTVVFAVLAVLLTLTVYTGELNRMILLFPFVWAVIDEATKPLVQGRHFAWYDVGLNELGVILGYMVMLFWKGCVAPVNWL